MFEHIETGDQIEISGRRAFTGPEIDQMRRDVSAAKSMADELQKLIRDVGRVHFAAGHRQRDRAAANSRPKVERPLQAKTLRVQSCLCVVQRKRSKALT